MDRPVTIGSIVFSKAGRDGGRFYIVVEIVDDKFVKIADGDVRRLSSPKKKKLMHLKATAEVHEKLREKLLSGAVIYDAEIYSALKKYNL